MVFTAAALLSTMDASTFAELQTAMAGGGLQAMAQTLTGVIQRGEK